MSSYMSARKYNDSLQLLTLEELQQTCRMKKLDTNGSVSDLIERLTKQSLGVKLRMYYQKCKDESMEADRKVIDDYMEKIAHKLNDAIKDGGSSINISIHPPSIQDELIEILKDEGLNVTVFYISNEELLKISLF